MKKLFVILPCLLLCLIMVAVPVSAASSEVVYEVTVTDGYCIVPSDQLDQGLYTVTFEPTDSDSFFTVAPVEITSVPYEQERYAVPGLFYNDMQVFLIVELDDDYQFNYFFGAPAQLLDMNGKLTISTYTPPPSPVGIFEVFGTLGAWIPVALGSLIGIFWTGSSLTFLGVLAVFAVAFATILMIIFIIRRFLGFRS